MLSIFCTTFIVPTPDEASLHVIGTQTVGQRLILECNMTTVRGITSRVDMVWSSNGLEFQRFEGVHFYSALNNSVVYTTSYEIIQLSTIDDEKTYLCEVFVNVTPPVVSNASVTLNLTGKNRPLHK